MLIAHMMRYFCKMMLMPLSCGIFADFCAISGVRYAAIFILLHYSASPSAAPLRLLPLALNANFKNIVFSFLQRTPNTEGRQPSGSVEKRACRYRDTLRTVRCIALRSRDKSTLSRLKYTFAAADVRPTFSATYCNNA